MIGSRLYGIYGLVMLGALSFAQWTGYSFTSPGRHMSPRTLRENPGSYRSNYGWTPRWYGGK